MATCDTSRVLPQWVHDIFSEERIVSKHLWPPRSPDLTTCDYFLWGQLKNTEYESNPRTIQEMKENIDHAVAAIKVTMLNRVYQNVIRRVQMCIDAGVNHFQQLLWWYTLSVFGYCINFCIYAMLRTWATFSWPTLYHEPQFDLQLLSTTLYLPINADQTYSKAADMPAWSINLAYFP